MVPLPSNRLLWIVAGLILPAALAGAVPVLWPVCLVALLLVAAAALADLAMTGLRTVAPRAAEAAVVRLTKATPGTIPIVLALDPAVPARVRVSLALPDHFESAEADLAVGFPDGAPRARIHWKCTPGRRGNFAAGPLSVEWSSRLGLWLVRAWVPLGLTIRVYPNLMAERRQLAALWLRRGAFGVQLQRTLGRGRDFERVREYQPGDSYDEVYWKGTAKRGKPVSKVFQVERTQEIYVVIDASRLSGRPAGDGQETILERFVGATLILLRAAESQGDRFGLAVHGSATETFLGARAGDRHFGACREAVYSIQPTPGSPDFAELASFLRVRLRRRALLVFFTDLSDPVLAEEFAAHVRILSRQHLVLVIQVRIPGVEPLFSSPLAGEDELAGRLTGHYQWAEAEATRVRLEREGITLTTLDHSNLAADLLARYVDIKRRQLL